MVNKKSFSTLIIARSVKFLLICFAVIIIFSSTTSVAAQTYKVERDSAMLYFKADDGVLYEYYKTNKTELTSILKFVQMHTQRLQNGLSHINIVSYIKESQIDDPQAINNASLQASVVRAQFKTRFNIPHSAITFYIDTTRNANNVVRVDYVNMPVPLYSNSEIYYTENGSWATERAQMQKYSPSVPYTNYFMRLAKFNSKYTLGEIATTDNRQLPYVAGYDREVATNIITADSRATNAATSAAKDRTDDSKQQVFSFPSQAPVAPAQQTPPPASNTSTSENITPPSEAQKSYSQFAKSNIQLTPAKADVFGIKTNLLFWAAAVPNLQMEFYAGQRISINLEGAYTWGWFLPDDKAYYGWNAGGEIRVWLKGKKQFNGHFFGVYGAAGQYDFKFSQLGYQGDFFNAGISYGYMLPISKNFYMEFSLGVGVLGFLQNNYEYVDQRNVSVQKLPYQYFVGPTKANVSILWKF